MAPSYYATAFNTGGTAVVGDAGSCYKDLVIADAAAGDVIVAWVQDETAGNGAMSVSAFATQAGSTSSWTISTLVAVSQADCFNQAGFCTVTATGSVTVRGSARVVSTPDKMSVVAYRIPAAEVGATFGFLGTAAGSATGLISGALSSTATVFYCGADWTAANMGTGTIPSGGTIGANYFDTTSYSVWSAYWAAQASGTRNYGPSTSAQDITAALFYMAAPAGGGTNYTKTPADNLGITDSVVANLTTAGVKTPADTVGITDSVTVVKGQTRAFADNIGITDTGSPQMIVDEEVTGDGMGLTDVVTVVKGMSRPPADAVGLTDSVTVVLTGSATQSQADTVGIIDSVTIIRTISSTPADPVGLTDVVTAIKGVVSAPADNVGLSDEVTVVQTIVRNINDTVGLTDVTSASETGSGTATIYLGTTPITGVYLGDTPITLEG